MEADYLGVAQNKIQLNEDELSCDRSTCQQQQRCVLIRKFIQHSQSNNVKHCCGTRLRSLLYILRRSLNTRFKDLNCDDANHANHSTA